MDSKYELGDLVRVTGTFTNEAGDLVDPTVVNFAYIDPAGTRTDLVYGTDVEVVKSAVGVYYVDVDADQVGRWRYRFWSTGSGQAANESYFVVRPSEFD